MARGTYALSCGRSGTASRPVTTSACRSPPARTRATRAIPAPARTRRRPPRTPCALSTSSCCTAPSTRHGSSCPRFPERRRALEYSAGMLYAPRDRHLLRAKDLADARYADPLGVDDMAAAAGLSRAHFSREFRRAFGVSPHVYLLTRRLERAAALLRNTDRSVADICFSVGLQSLGSFTSSFTRTYGVSPTAYRGAFPPAAARAVVPSCIVRAYGRPQRSTFREDS